MSQPSSVISPFSSTTIQCVAAAFVFSGLTQRSQRILSSLAMGALPPIQDLSDSDEGVNKKAVNKKPASKQPGGRKKTVPKEAAQSADIPDGGEQEEMEEEEQEEEKEAPATKAAKAKVKSKPKSRKDPKAKAKKKKTSKAKETAESAETPKKKPQENAEVGLLIQNGLILLVLCDCFEEPRTPSKKPAAKILISNPQFHKGSNAWTLKSGTKQVLSVPRLKHLQLYVLSIAIKERAVPIAKLKETVCQFQGRWTPLSRYSQDQRDRSQGPSFSPTKS